MKRVLVIGAGGAGKTTLARQMGQILGLPLVHLDALYWQPGWQETPRPEWEAKVRELVRQDGWIMDGNYGGTLAVRLEAADAVVFLDTARLRCLWRVLKRRLRYHNRTRPDLAPGCPEQLDWEFIRWIWTFPRLRRPEILHGLKQWGKGREVFVLNTPRQVQAFLEELRERTALTSTT